MKRSQRQYLFFSIQVWFFFFLALILVGCSGGISSPVTTMCSTCAANTLTGQTSSGAILTGEIVSVYDSTGTEAVGNVNSAGIYTINVKGLTPPFIVRIEGFVNGNPVVLHSPALASDVGRNSVSVTPLTELMLLALGIEFEGQIKAGTVYYDRINTATVISAESLVKTFVKDVLVAAGVTGTVDLRTTEFTPNHTGLDKSLDMLQLVIASPNYQISTIFSNTPVVVNLSSAFASISPLVIPADGTSKVTAALTAASEFQTQLDLVSAELKGAATVAANLSGFFTTDFFHTGLNASDFITTVLSQEDPPNKGGFTLKGAKLDSVQVKRIIDASNMEVSFRVVPASAYRHWTETMLIQKVTGKWLMKGDGHYAHIGVFTQSRLKETPLITAEMLALSDVTPVDPLVVPTYYQRAIKDANGAPILNNGFPLKEWLGSPVDPSWGYIGWVGGGITLADRVLGQQYNHIYSKTNSRVSNYLRLEVSNSRVSGTVDHVLVTGDGLPVGGLTLVRSPAGYPRPYFIYQGDSFHWEAFNSERCAQVDQVVNGVHSVPNCALNWDAISSGSVYTFTLFTSSNTTLETLTSKLAVKPYSETTLFTLKNEWFPQFDLPTAYRFNFTNMFNDVNGSFMPGKTFPLVWTNPTRQGNSLGWISFNTQDTLNVQDNQSVPLYGLNISGTLPTSQSFIVNGTLPVTWAWATIIGYDIFGNEVDHEVSPNNPY